MTESSTFTCQNIPDLNEFYRTEIESSIDYPKYETILSSAYGIVSYDAVSIGLGAVLIITMIIKILLRAKENKEISRDIFKTMCKMQLFAYEYDIQERFNKEILNNIGAERLRKMYVSNVVENRRRTRKYNSKITPDKKEKFLAKKGPLNEYIITEDCIKIAMEQVNLLNKIIEKKIKSSQKPIALKEIQDKSYKSFNNPFAKKNY